MKHSVTLLCVIIAALAYAQSAQADDRRLVYQIEVTDPGSRNQGWHGTLYDRDGGPMVVPPGRTVTNGAGAFVSVPCTVAFVPCGMIYANMIDWMTEPHNGNVIMDPNAWAYRLYVTAEGSRSEGWHGELLHGGGAVPAQPNSFDAPMGPFRWYENPYRWGRHGWFHVSWRGNGSG